MNTSNEKLGLAQRDKYWSERNVDEKLTALRDQIQQLTYQIGHVCLLVERLMTHSHADGKIVAPIESRERHELFLPNSLRINHDK
jgi:hypothetical protein